MTFPLRSNVWITFDARTSRPEGDDAVADASMAAKPNADCVETHAVGNPRRFARQPQRLEVERLREQQTVPHEQQAARTRTGRRTLAATRRVTTRRIQGPDVDALVLGLDAALQEEKSASVGQELRPVVPHRLLWRIERGRRGDRAAIGRHL